MIPEEILYALPTPEIITDLSSYESGIVSVSVTGREAENGVLSAREGDVIEVAVKKGEGRRITLVGYSYVDESGVTHDVEVVAGTDAAGADKNGKVYNDKTFTLKKNSSSEYIYTILAPKGKIKSIVVQIESGEEEEEVSDTADSATTDGTGKTIGVGAAFSLVYGNSETTAEIGRRQSFTAGSLTVNAESEHSEDISSAAGSDPLEGDWDADATKDFALDASVAINILDNNITAKIAEGMKVILSGDLSVNAKEDSETETTASAFSVGESTAVGASVALNIANSSTVAEVLSDVIGASKAAVTSDSHSEDVTKAIATAMGGDIGRTMAKIGDAADSVEDGANKVLDGSYIDSLGDNKKSTKTNDKINQRLDEKKGSDGQKTNSNASTSSNALRSTGVSTNSEDAGSEGTSEAQSQIGANSDNTIGDVGSKTGSKVQVAAAVGITVASHDVSTTVAGIHAEDEIAVSAENTGNFNTTGTGAAMSLAKKANSIAFGVAVSVNNNKATTTVTGDLISSENKNVTVTSRVTQNMDGDFLGKLAAQSLSGSVAGNGSSISLGGAVSTVVSNAESIVNVNDGVTIEGGDVAIEATDKSKLAARAGGLSLSKGSSVGMGIASTTIISSNRVEALLGNDVTVNADSFKLRAEKEAVTDDDFKQLIDMRYLITDSSNLNDDQREDANTGLIDVHKGVNDDSYKVEVNLSEEKLLDAVDGLNFLSSQNTYAEAIAGSISTGSTKANLAGSFAVAVTENNVLASIGNNAKITTRTGAIDINAKNGATTRVIAGSLSAAPAKASVGATVSVMINSDSAIARTGKNASFDAKSDFLHNSSQSGDMQVFTAAMSVAAGADAKNAIGGAINVLVNKGAAESILGDGTAVKAGNDAGITSDALFDLMLISGSANVAVGPQASVAAGGTVNVIVDKVTSRTTLGNNVAVTSGKNTTITSGVSDQLISGALSASAAVSASGKSGAGSVNVIVSKSVADTTIGKGIALKAEAGDIKIRSDNDAWMLNATLAASGSNGTAIGGSFNVNVYERESSVHMSDGTLEAGRNLFVQANGRDKNVMAGFAAAGSVSGTSIAANIAVLIENSTIQTIIEQGITAFAAGNAFLESNFNDFTVGAAGTIAGSLSGSAAGVTSLTVIKNNTVETKLSASRIAAFGTTNATALSEDSTYGVYVGATAIEKQYLGAAGVAVSGGNSVNGVVNVLVNNNKIIADASKASLDYQLNGTTKKYSSKVTVKASDDTRQIILAGGVNLSGGTGVGASVVTLVSGKEVNALAHDMGATGDIKVIANNNDDVTMFAVSAGAASSTSVQIGAAVQVMDSKVLAQVGSEVTSQNGGFDLIANNNTNLVNGAVAVAGGGSAAVTPVAVVTYFTGETSAKLLSNSTVSVKKNMNIKTTADKTIDLYSIGAAVGGTAGVSGTANVLALKDSALAVAENGTTLTSNDGELNIETRNDYTLSAISGTVAVGGTAGVGINAVVSVLKSSAIAELGGRVNLVNGKHDVNVKAISNRKVTNIAATLSGGTVGTGVNVMVLVSGSKMSQDAADMMAYGNSSSKSGDKTFDANSLMATVSSNDNGGSKYYNDKLDGATLAEDTAGNGHYESSQGAGKNSGDSRFDASSGYRSDDFDSTSYDDKSGVQRGENLNASDTKDIADAKQMNTYTYTSAPDDAVIARITKNAIIQNVNDVNVLASQPVMIDLLGVNVSGGAVGVGVSTSVSILHGNVSASSLGTISGANNVTVTAESISGGKLEDRSDALKPILKNLDPSSDGIRVIGATMGAGAVGVSVGVSVNLTDNVTQALLGGNVLNTKNVTVEANQDYGNVLAANGTLGAGAVAVSASASAAQSEAVISSELDSDSYINITGDLNVLSKGTLKANSITATAGAGAVSVNAGVALTINRITQTTGIRKGSTITAKNIYVKAVSDTVADSTLLGVSVGANGTLINVAMSQVDANLDTYVTGSTISATDTFEVYSDVLSTATPKVASLAGGGMAAGGNVLLAFNETKSKTHVSDSIVKNANSMNIVADLQGKATSQLAAGAVGGTSVGLSVNYADMKADNRAILENTNINVKNLRVQTGRGSHDNTSAYAETVSGSMGYISVDLNSAIARNNTKSYAMINGGYITAADGVTVSAGDIVNADAKVTGVNISHTSVAANAVIALNDADTRVIVSSPRIATNKNVDFKVVSNASTSADIVTGGGSLIEAKASVGVAYGRSSSIIDAQVDDLTAASLNVTNTPTSTTTSKITNATYSVAAATAMVGAAYSQDVFDTKVKLGTSTISGDINVLTDYDVSATADVTPHKGGIDAKLLNLQANLALSRNVARASADLIIDTQAKVTAKNVTVKTTGKGNTTAIIRPVKVEVTGVKVVANIANSELSLTQDALIHLNGELNVSGDVNVQSMSNDSKAVASIGTAGVEAGGTVSINVADLGISYAVAKNNMTRTAGIIGKYNPNQIAEPYEETYMETEKYQETMTSIDFYNNVLTKNIPYKIIRQYTERYRDASGALQEIDYVVVELEREVEKTVTKYRYKILGYDGNVINANALNVIAGMNSGSTSTALAQSNGSKSVSLVSAGGLSAESTASDSSNVTLAGFVGNITKTAKVHAETNSNSLAEGMMPGSLTLVSGSVSNVAANVGSSADPQSAKVNFSDSVKLTADILDILADNNGNAKATMEQGTSYSLAKVSTSSQPTNSWYDTGVTIGNGVQLTATGKPSGLTNVPYSQTNIEESSDEIWPLRIVSTTNSAADSAVNSSSIGVGLNMNLMQGKNTITDNNHINVGDDVRLISTWGLRMITRSSTQAHAETVLDGGGLWDGQLGKATNTINRNAGVSVGNNAFIKSEQGSIDFESVLGGKDNIETTVRVKGGGGISAGRSSAETVLTEKNQIQLGMNANITAKKSVNMSALATSHQANNGRGIYTYAKTDSGGLGVDPEAKATTTLNIDNNININKNGSKKSRIEGTDYFVLMNVGNDALYVFTDSGSDGKGIGGASAAESTVYTNINNIIWLDNTHIQAQGASLNAYTSRNDIAKFYVESLAELYAAGGVVKPVSKISGTAKNEIRSSNTANVTGNFLHTAFDPMVDTDTYLKSDYRRLEVKIYKWTVSTTVEKARKEWNWNGSSRCDFCDGTNSSTSSSSSNSSSNSSTSDFSSYLNNLEVYVPNPINTNRVRYVTGSQSGSAQAAQGTLSGSLSKGLATVNDINRVVNGLDSITKARYGEEDDLAAGEIYVLEFKTTLREDVKLTRHQLTEYRLWTDALTDHDVYLLPNSTRLYANAIGRLQYVSEVLSGDVLGNGETHDVDVVTALTSYAFHHPILPIESSGSLDFDGGWLTIPSKADFELYLNEVSGRWIIDQMTSGFMRMYEADQDAINRFTSGSYDLPEGNVIEGLIDGGMQNGWKLYWVNADPDTAVSDDQALVYLLVNETTNEIDAYRTTRRMIRNGEDPIDVSVYLVRDSKSDRMGIERYNMLFFDTEEGMESLFVVVTDVPEEREMDMPMPLEIKLRAFDIGAYTFAYSLSGHFFVMMDGSDGYVSIFNGFYRATIDDSFESDYVLIEGIGTNTPEVTLKANQPIWAEWSGTNRAEDIAGNRYVKEDGHWYREADAENAEELIPMDGKLYVTDRESLKNDSFVRAQ